MTSFTDMLAAGYGFTEPAITLGSALEGGTVHKEPKVKVPIAMLNRHGLVAGATGTGKTRTLQLLTEQLSASGVPVFVADIKGDLSGLALPGQAGERVSGRANDIGWSWTGAGVPVEFVSLTGALGVQLRATVSSFGPLLLGKVLSLNETQTSSDGRGVVTCLELADAQDRPALFSTFMMWLLAELYHNLPVAGDLPKPKLVFFFDEAHLLFDDAPKAFLDQIQRVVRLIPIQGGRGLPGHPDAQGRPDRGTGAAGHRIQHALRAHTPDDDTALKATVRTYPKTAFYDLEETLTSLGTGEAVITVLDAKGRPTPVVAARLIPPASRMAPLSPEELQADIRQSDLLAEYGQAVDRESARELLARRMARTEAPSEPQAEEPAPRRGGGVGRTAAKAAGVAVIGALTSTIGRTVGREVVRGLFGLLGVKPPRTGLRAAPHQDSDAPTSAPC